MEIAYIENLYRSEHGMRGRHKRCCAPLFDETDCTDAKKAGSLHGYI